MSDYLVKGPVTPELISRLIGFSDEKNDAGGISAFIGRVRADKSGNKTVVAIDYSAYDEMVNSVASGIKADIMLEFTDVKSVKILHSAGIVRAGEISLFVLVEAGHRREAMDACSQTVELIKAKLPVWKRELYDNESHEWKQN
jgi:molybdopterin synthase catalytic subunit